MKYENLVFYSLLFTQFTLQSIYNLSLLNVILFSLFLHFCSSFIFVITSACYNQPLTCSTGISLMMFEAFLWGTSTQCFAHKAFSSLGWAELFSLAHMFMQGQKTLSLFVPIPNPSSPHHIKVWREIWEVPQRRWGYCNPMVRHNLKKKSQRQLLILVLIKGFF